MMASTGNQSKRLETVVQLGFSVDIEDDEHRMLVGHHNPDNRVWDGGQLGGRPTWLNPKDIPESYLKCLQCETPMLFVCQLYAPSEEVNPNAYHRTFYVFACPNTAVCAAETTGSVRVLRTQLPRENPYYPDEPDVDWSSHLSTSWDVHLCKVCGQRGRGKCPIQKEYFCGNHHQKEYKTFAFDMAEQSSSGSDIHFLPSVLTESELVVEEEPAHGNDDNERQKGENVLFEDEGRELGGSDDYDDDKTLEQKDLNEMTGAADETVTKDPCTMKFYERISQAAGVQSQCLRYLRWPGKSRCLDTGTPLWIQSTHQPDYIPSCSSCGSDRKFEFQIMPQMLHYLLKDSRLHQRKEEKERIPIVKKEDVEALKTATSIMEQAPPDRIPPDFAANKEKAIDALRNRLMEERTKAPSWGTVAVYTCINSCGGSDLSDELGAYIEEFAWKQPSLDWA